MMIIMVMGTVRYDILSLKQRRGGNQREAGDPKKSDLPDVPSKIDSSSDDVQRLIGGGDDEDES